MDEDELERRVEELEKQVGALKKMLGSVTSQVDDNANLIEDAVLDLDAIRKRARQRIGRLYQQARKDWVFSE